MRDTNFQKNILQSPWFVFGRVFFGLMWLYEVVWGHNWKWGNPKWVGEGAGTWIREDVANAVATGTWQWSEWLVNVMVLPYAEFWSYAVIVLQLAIALSLIFGFFVRPIAAIGVLHMAFMFLDGHSRIPPFFLVGFLFILAVDAGRYYGLDGWLLKKLSQFQGGLFRAVSAIIKLSLPDQLRVYVGLPLLFVGAVYFLLQTVIVESARFRMVSLDLAVIFGLIILGLALAKRTEVVPLVARLIGIFVGYRFLHEIWIRHAPALNGLPGWATTEKLAEPFSLIVANHYAPITWLAETLIIPYMSIWLAVFGVVQFLVGFMLVLGIRTRTASIVGLFFLTFLLLFGFARYTPFILGLLILAFVLDNGRVLRLDSLFKREEVPETEPPMLSKRWMVLTSLVFIVSITLAMLGNITPGDYREAMGPVTMAMFSILAFSLSAVWLAQKNL